MIKNTTGATMSKPVLVSGIQPSGHIMIGNYIGAIKNWVALQDQYDCSFFLVDLHTITVKQDPKILRQHCYDLTALYIACGIDPTKNTLFVQSHVPGHAELAWILNCFTYIGELNRMTQFKDKSKRYATNINVGLFDYPVLMAADILLYDAELVPVGEDQKQHLELTRNLAQRFNTAYGDVFITPEPYIPPLGARLMSLQDPSKKMSKSDDNANNYIAMLDEPKIIIKKIKRAVTDSGSEIIYNKDKPGVSNLLTLFSAITETKISELEKQYQGQGYGKFKQDLADAMVEFLRPIREKHHKLINDKSELDKILKIGAEKANQKASKKLAQIRDVLGFIPAG